MTNSLAEREFMTDRVPSSSLHEVFITAQDWSIRHGREPIALHVGEPAYPMPSIVVDAMVGAIASRQCAYTGAEGSPQLREALTAKLTTQGIQASPDTVFVTPGSCQGLAAIGTALRTPGAGMLIPAVHWPIYKQQGIMHGYDLRGYLLGECYALVPDLVEEAADANTRVLLVNSPANPTGAVADVTVLRGVLELARRNDWIVISDEAYECFVYEGTHTPLAALETDVPESERRVFSVFTFSKSHAMTGCRVGYTVAPNRAFAERLRRVQECSIIAPPTPAQVGALAGLGAHNAVAMNVAHVRGNRDAVMPMLQDAGLIATPPAGGWYAMLDVSASGADGQQLSDRLLTERGVAVAPAAAFSFPSAPKTRSAVRISMAGDRTELMRGCEELVDLVDRMRDERCTR